MGCRDASREERRGQERDTQIGEGEGTWVGKGRQRDRGWRGGGMNGRAGGRQTRRGDVLGRGACVEGKKDRRIQKSVSRQEMRDGE